MEFQAQRLGGEACPQDARGGVYLTTGVDTFQYFDNWQDLNSAFQLNVSSDPTKAAAFAGTSSSSRRRTIIIIIISPGGLELLPCGRSAEV